MLRLLTVTFDMTSEMRSYRNYRRSVVYACIHEKFALVRNFADFGFVSDFSDVSSDFFEKRLRFLKCLFFDRGTLIFVATIRRFLCASLFV